MDDNKDKNEQVESFESNLGVVSGDDNSTAAPMARRTFLAGLGMASAALAAGGLLGNSLQTAYAKENSVTDSVYGQSFRPDHPDHPLRRADWINVREFGAKGDGTADDTSAIQAALNSANGRNVIFPTGTYRVTSTLLVPLIRLVGEGSGRTTVVFDQMAGLDGFVFQAETNVGREGGVEHMTLMSKGAHGRHAISTPTDSSLYFTYRTRYFFRGLEFRGNILQSISSGFVYDYGWETCIRMGDCWGAYIEEIDAIGIYKTSLDPETQPDHTFLKMSAAGGMLSVRVSGVTTHGVKRGIEIGDRVFFFISHVDIAHSYEGLVSTGTTVFSEGRIHDSLFNSQRVCLHLNNRSWTSIHNVAVGRHKSGYDHGGEWYGFKLEQVNKSWISNIRVQADTSITKFSGTAYGFHFKNCGALKCDGLTPGLGLDYAIYLDNCPQNVYDGINFQGVSGVGFSFQNITRDCVIGTHVFSNGWTKYEYGAVDKSRISIVQKDLQLESKLPYLVMRETDGAADQKNWKWTINNGVLNRQIQNDSEGETVNYELVTRLGTTVTQMEWRANSFYLNGAMVQTKQLNPINDNEYTLGSMSNRWQSIYAGSPTIVTSDVRDKENIHDSDLGLSFINALRPVSYKFKDYDAEITEMTDGADGEQTAVQRTIQHKFNRPHYGLISQEVKEVLMSLGIGDFAGWTEDQATKKQGLRYEEFVAPLIKAVQELSSKVIALDQELSAVKSRG